MQYGYILDVLKPARILSNVISRVDCNIIIEAEIEIISYIPAVGDIKSAEIILIFKEGIFAKIEIENIKVFINNNKFSDYIFQNDLYVSATDDTKTLNVGKKIMVEIGGVKYTNKKYSMYGDILNI